MIKARTPRDLFKRHRRPGDLVFSLVFFLLFSLFLALNLGAETSWAAGTAFFA